MVRDIYENFDVIPESKNVILWGINQESGEIFCETLNRQIPVKCFVDVFGEFQGESERKLFGKPVLTRDALLNSTFIKGNSFILAGKKTTKGEELEWLEKYYKGAYYLCSASDIDTSIRESENLFIFGAGSSGKRTYKLLQEQGIHIKAFIDNDSTKWNKEIDDDTINRLVCGPEIIGEDAAVIISSRYYSEIKELLFKRGIPEKNIFIDIRNSREFSEKPICYMDRRNIWFEDVELIQIIEQEWGTFLWIALVDFYNKKKIILYGVNELTSQFLTLFTLLDIQVAYCVDNITTKEALKILGGGCKYRDIQELVYEDMSDKIVYVIKKEKNDSGIEDADYTILEKIGLVYFKQIRMFNRSANTIRNSKIEMGLGKKRDWLLGHTYIYKMTSPQYPGYIVLGNEETAKKRILILGNSTSDVGLYENYIKSWPEFLFDKMNDTVIFCGGMATYGSKKELLKLLRDGKQLSLNLVISCSGFNDIGELQIEGFPYARKRMTEESMRQDVLGIKTLATHAEEWIESEKMMKIIANSYGAEFLGVFQPILSQKKYKSFNEKVIYAWSKELWWMKLEKYEEYQKEVSRAICHIPYICDMTNVFWNEKNEMFRDICHLTEEGNRILANEIFQLIC